MKPPVLTTVLCSAGTAMGAEAAVASWERTSEPKPTNPTQQGLSSPRDLVLPGMKLYPHPQRGGNFDSSFPCHEKGQDHGTAHTTSCERLVTPLWVHVVYQRAGDLCRQEVLNHRRGCSSATWQHTTHETGWKKNLGFIFSELICPFTFRVMEWGMYTPILISQVSRLKSPNLSFWEDQKKPNKPPAKLQYHRRK